MPKAKFDLPEIPAAAQKPIFAGVGAGDLAYTAVKEYVADVQKKVTEVQKGVVKTVDGFEPKALRKQAVDTLAARRSAVETRVAELRDEALALPTRVQKAVDETASTATSTYADLAKRGETLVTRIRKAQPAVAVEVKTTKTKPATVKVAATKVAPKPAKKAPAKKTTAKKAPAKKAPAKKAPAAKKTTTTQA